MAADIPNTSIEVLKIVVPGIVGAASAIIGQYVANVFADRRHRQEFEHRDRQLTVQFLSPLSSRRVEAFEVIYDVIQGAIEEAQLSMQAYLRVRPLLLYVDPNDRGEALSALEALLSATRKNDGETTDRAVGRLKKVRQKLEDSLGVPIVNRGISQLLDSLEKEARDGEGVT